MKLVSISILFFILCLSGSNVANAQTFDNEIMTTLPSEISISGSVIQSPVLSKSFWGGSFDFKYYPVHRWATGLMFSLAQKRITDTFSYSIAQPELSYWNVGWINQFVLFDKGHFTCNVSLTNGFMQERLGDAAIQERYRTRYGYNTRAKEVASNYYYFVQPGIELGYKLINGNHEPDLYLIGSAKYRLALGDSKFASASQFSNYELSMGLMLWGFADDKK